MECSSYPDRSHGPVPCRDRRRAPTFMRPKGALRVGDGSRTHNFQIHSLVLCQLNYTHHAVGNMIKEGHFVNPRSVLFVDPHCQSG